MAVLKATKRTALGTRSVRRLRKGGEVPGIIYGHGEESLPVTLNQHDMDVAILHGERVLELDVEGQEMNVLIKDVQYDTFGQEILHVDLARVGLDERVEITIPVALRGTPAGVSENGVLQQNVNDVTIECAVRSIPEEIRVMVHGMKVGDVMTVGDLALPEGAKLLDNPDMVVCSVTVMVEVEEVEAEEAPAEPEIIGEKKEEGEGPPEAS